jgi:hypothetical protein
MTPEQIRIAIAESLGWQFHGNDARHPDWTGGVYEPLSEVVPNWPEDLNAVHELEQYLGSGECERYAHALITVISEQAVKSFGPEARLAVEGNFGKYWMMAFATAPQRCEAYLRVKGLWKE